jgi:hypothetical protein
LLGGRTNEGLISETPGDNHGARSGVETYRDLTRDFPDSTSNWPKTERIQLSRAIQVLARFFHGELLGLLANFATEWPVRRQSRDRRAHLDTHEA